jgi:hypothetical protein
MMAAGHSWFRIAVPLDDSRPAPEGRVMKKNSQRGYPFVGIAALHV